MYIPISPSLLIFQKKSPILYVQFICLPPAMLHILPFYHILSTDFCNFDPLHDQVVLTCALLLVLSPNFVSAEHPIMSTCLQLVVKET
jgi:hypothetical protein